MPTISERLRIIRSTCGIYGGALDDYITKCDTPASGVTPNPLAVANVSRTVHALINKPQPPWLQTAYSSVYFLAIP